MELWHVVLSVVGIVFVSGAVYGGIRNDIKNIHKEIAEHREDIREIKKDGCGACLHRRHDDR